MKGDREVIAAAKREFPHLTGEMLVSPGRAWEDWMTKPTLDQYIDEKRNEERQLWWTITRRWEMTLKKSKILVAEEDGLGIQG
jgi:hypothetical protein